MKTDLESFKTMLKLAGVAYVQQDNFVTIEAQDGPNNLGYSGFVVTFTFEPNTKGLLNVGIWQ